MGRAPGRIPTGIPPPHHLCTKISQKKVVPLLSSSFVLPRVRLSSEPSPLPRPTGSSLQLSPRLPTAQLHRSPPASNSVQGAEGQAGEGKWGKRAEGGARGSGGDCGKEVAETDSKLVMVRKEADRPEAHSFFLQHELEMRILTRS